MTLFSTKNLSHQSKLGIWHITESKQQLMKLVGEGVKDASRPIQAAENLGIHWYASRVILQHLYPEASFVITKDANNKPLLYVNNAPYFISITHSYDFAALLVSPHTQTGLDMERIDPRINRVAAKFMNATEFGFAPSTDDILARTLIWAAKETLYKVHGKREIDFRNNLLVHPFDPKQAGCFHGQIKKDAVDWLLNIHYEVIDNYVLTYAIHDDDEF